MLNSSRHVIKEYRFCVYDFKLNQINLQFKLMVLRRISWMAIGMHTRKKEIYKSHINKE